jgi:hypothetical protein
MRAVPACGYTGCAFAYCFGGGSMRGQPGFFEVERAEFLINDRMSFMRFPGPVLADRVPDARTTWLIREKLTKAGAIEGLFAPFDAALRIPPSWAAWR